MCGICGFVGEGGPEILQRMTTVLVHRGPDDEGMYTDARIGLGVRRLSIIDLAGGHQPMTNEDETVQVVFNGEIYNYKAVREHLQKLGHRFRTRSDTEVLVHAYEEYGEAGVHLLRGMFAYALWDTRTRKLVLTRDRLGIKPLYYTRVGETLVFASEVKSLLEHPLVTAEPDFDALDAYLAFHYVPGPRTMFRRISKLPPAHTLTFQDGRETVRRYWDVIFNDRAAPTDLREATEEFAAIFHESVRLHMVSDVPLGVLLSGGIDSSAVVAGMSHASRGSVQTFSVGFDIAGMHNEQKDAAAVARHFGTDHHELVVNADAADLLPQLAWYLDEPIADPAVLPTYLLCRSARETVPVVLTGEGGDELLAGYPRYGWFLIAKRLQRVLPASVRDAAVRMTSILPLLPWRVRRGIENVLADRDDAQRHLHWVGNVDAPIREDVLTPDLRRLSQQPIADMLDTYLGSDQTHLGESVHRLMSLDIHTWLVDDILTKMDKMSMAASVEARVPFLDHALVEFVAAMPVTLKMKTFGSKRLLREAMKGVLPRHTLARRKHAFLVPVDQWLRGSLRGFLNDVLLSQRSRERGWFRPAGVARLIEEHQQGAPHGRSLWNLLCIELWSQAFLDGRPAPHLGLSAG